MDIETLAGCFTYTDINVDTEEVNQFVIHNNVNQIGELISHLYTIKGHIGFNNINFDYPVIHFIIKWYEKAINNSKKEFTFDDDNQTIIDLIYNQAQKLIEIQNNPINQKSSTIKPNDIIIPQLDLFRLWHFNNKARMTSLKSLQISMNYPNVMEMDIHHSQKEISVKELNNILKYNKNDVLSTFEFYKLSKDKINLRRNLTKKYNIPCINYPDSKIGEELVLKLYCDKTNRDKYDVKKLRTVRDKIHLKDCIFDYISFQSIEFNNLLDKLKSKTIYETKGSIEESVIYKGFKYDYGTGGIHGCIKPGIYESDDDYVIIDCDVASLYPSIAILNRLYPEHLGETFCDVYENDIVKPRLEAKKAGDMVMADGFKLSANSVYGKSNDEHSFLKDSLYTMKTTINGELMLSMLAEELVDTIPDLQMLQVNTDGITVKINVDYINIYYEICKDWEQKTKLTLEYVNYSKMIIRDVNNYIAVSDKGKVKRKGAFVIDKEFHQDNSFKIIPIAISEYFINNKTIESTIKNHTNIYDFCGRQKFKGQDYGVTHWIDYNQRGMPIHQRQRQQKNVRYYISIGGCTFIKEYAKGSNEVINKGYTVTIFNNYEKFDYGIDYSFYIKECLKEINIIENKQLTLF